MGISVLIALVISAFGVSQSADASLVSDYQDVVSNHIITSGNTCGTVTSLIQQAGTSVFYITCSELADGSGDILGYTLQTNDQDLIVVSSSQ
ncbi:MAG: hypothetical protein V3V13_06050 [Paracoccaceae bacterium]